MTQMEQKPHSEKPEASTRVEEFLKAVESKATDEVHRRLLRACRSDNPTVSMETELKRIIDEILHEA